MVAQLIENKQTNLPASAGDARDTGSIPWLGGSLEEGSGNLLKYSCLENPMDRAEGPSRLQSMGSQRLRYDLSGHACIYSHIGGLVVI